MKMTSVVGLDTKKSKKEYRAEYFMEKNENDENVFELWLTKNKEALKINAYDVSNHPGILLRWPGIESLYDTMKPHFEKLVLQNGKKNWTNWTCTDSSSGPSVSTNDKDVEDLQDLSQSSAPSKETIERERMLTCYLVPPTT